MKKKSLFQNKRKQITKSVKPNNNFVMRLKINNQINKLAGTCPFKKQSDVKNS